LPGELAKAGYQTHCVGKMHVYPQRRRLGFDAVELHDGYLGYTRRMNTPLYESQTFVDDYLNWLKNDKGKPIDVIDAGLEVNSYMTRPWQYEEELHPTNWVTTRCIDFLRRREHDKPFFLMASYVRPHTPLDPPSCFYDMYKDKDLAEPHIGSWAVTEDPDMKGRRVPPADGIMDSELLRQARAGYYASITHLDHQIGRLLQLMSGSYSEYGSMLKDTIIIFTSDHGDMLGDHHFVRKSIPYRGSVNVPLIISRPPGYGAKKPIVVDEIAELRDIMPTILDFAGVDIPDSLDGVS
jgi:arylsulfatase A-like enzyme